MPDTLELDHETTRLIRQSLRLEGALPEPFDAKDLPRLFPNSGLYRYKKDDFVILQGDESKDVFTLCAGTVFITQTLGTAGAQLAVLKRGDVFGEMALMKDGERVANAIAAEDAVIFRLAKRDVEELIKKEPAVGQRLMTLAKERSG